MFRTTQRIYQVGVCLYTFIPLLDNQFLFQRIKGAQAHLAYNIHTHCHRFAAWAASRAASVSPVCRFTVETGKKLLESIGLNDAALTTPEALPDHETIDLVHRQWRDTMLRNANDEGLSTFTHGVAAKLINVYLKCRFVCGGYVEHPKVQCLHPPIDSLLLTSLAKEKQFIVQSKVFNDARKQRWSNFNSDEYEKVIHALKLALKGAPLWHAEEFWKGNR